jgi:cell wall-associated NlpC family hydrolase
MATAPPLRPSHGSVGIAVSLLLSATAVLAPVTAAAADAVPPADPASAFTVHAGRTPSTQALITRAALKVAYRQIGDRYTYGADGPDAFDCSGLVQFSFLRAGQWIPRTSGEQAKATKRVPAAQARRGDLAFFYDGDGVYHVAFYLGRNRILHAPGTGQRVETGEIWTTKVFFGRVR